MYCKCRSGDTFAANPIIGNCCTAERAPSATDWFMDLGAIEKVAYESVPMAPTLSFEHLRRRGPTVCFQQDWMGPSTALTSSTGNENEKSQRAEHRLRSGR